MRPASKLIIFDFDGTLADSWRDIATALNQTLSEARLEPVAASDVRAWIGRGVVPLLHRALPPDDQSPERIAALYARFRIHYEGCCLQTTALYPGIAECLARLSASKIAERHRATVRGQSLSHSLGLGLRPIPTGHTLAVLSNKPSQFLDRIIEGLGLASRFAVVLGGDTTPVNKPDPAAVEYLVRHIGAADREIWMVGDSPIDVATGRGAGARTVGCTWGLRGVDELRAAGPEFVVNDPGEIPVLIDER